MCKTKCVFDTTYTCSWLDKLGLSASKGAEVVARQTLWGLNYPLIAEDLNPNPVSEVKSTVA